MSRFSDALKKWETDKTATMVVPADFRGKSIPEDVVRDVVGAALFEAGPFVVKNHIGAFNELVSDRVGVMSYEAAIKLAAHALRFAAENMPAAYTVRTPQQERRDAASMGFATNPDCAWLKRGAAACVSFAGQMCLPCRAFFGLNPVTPPVVP